MAAKVSGSMQLAINFIEAATAAGYIVTTSKTIVTITRTFTPGDHNAYTRCDMSGSSILGLVPAKGGSEWGTDGASIGGYAGLRRGEYQLNISGVSIRFTDALKKLGIAQR
jgi:hypothetical protein